MANRIKIARGSQNNLPTALASDSILYGELYWAKEETGVSDGILYMGHPDGVEDGIDDKGPLPVAGARAMKSLYFEGLWDPSQGSYPTNPVVGSFWVASADGAGNASSFHYGDWMICITVNPNGSTQWIKSINQAITTQNPLNLQKNPLELNAGVISLKYDGTTLTVDASGSLILKTWEAYTLAPSTTIADYSVVGVDTAGQAILADNTSDATGSNVVGIAISTDSSGDGYIQVQKTGRITNTSWIFTDIGGPVYLGINGTLMQGTENIQSGQIAIQVGVAVSLTMMEIRIGTPFLFDFPSDVNYIPLTSTITKGDVSHAPTSDAVYNLVTGSTQLSVQDIIPSQDNVFAVGSPTARFAHIYTNEIHVGENSVFIGTLALEQNSNDEFVLGKPNTSGDLVFHKVILESDFTALPVIGLTGFTADTVVSALNELKSGIPAAHVSGDTGIGYVGYNGNTQASGRFDGSTTAPSHTNRLNYDGALHATNLYAGNSYFNAIYPNASGTTAQLDISNPSGTGRAIRIMATLGSVVVSAGTTLTLADADILGGINLSEGSGLTGFTAISLIGALNEVKSPLSAATALNTVSTLVMRDASGNFAAGHITVTDMTISGGLTVNGTTTTVNSTVIALADNVIQINSSLTGAPPSNLTAGLTVNRGTGTAYNFWYDEATQTFRVGQTGSMQAVATREDTPTANAIPYWNATLNEFNSSSITANASGALANIASINGWALKGNSSLNNYGFGADFPSGATGTNNFAFGSGSFTFLTSGNNNISVGASTLADVTSGSGNIAIGRASGQLIQNGANNTVLGDDSLTANISGNRNTVVGHGAANSATGSDNIIIGNSAASALTTGSNVIVIGNSAAASAVDAANEITLGSASIATFRIGATTIWTSALGVDFDALPGKVAGDTGLGFVRYNGATQSSGVFDGSTTAPTHSTRLNYDGDFHANTFYGSGASLTGTASNLKAGTVTNATFTTALTINTGAVTISGNADGTSALTLGSGVSSVSGSNSGDITLATDSGIASLSNGQTGIALGAPSSVTGSSTNAVTAHTHTHALDLTAAGLAAGSASVGFIKYNGTTQAAGLFDGGSAKPGDATTQLNFNGKFAATYLYTATLYSAGSAQLEILNSVETASATIPIVNQRGTSDTSIQLASNVGGITINAGTNVVLKDQFLASGINLSQSGTTGLTNFTASSIVGALNELKASPVIATTTTTGTITVGAGLGLASGVVTATPKLNDSRSTTGIIIPAYVYPTNIFSGDTVYHNLVALAKQYHNVPMIVIVNPANGPGTVTDGNYTGVIQLLQGAGIRILGYVHTSATTGPVTPTSRTIASVVADVNTWKSLYPAIDGIWIDEFPATATTVTALDTSVAETNLQYIQKIRAAALTNGFQWVFGNQGAPSSYTGVAYVQARAIDKVCIWESNTAPAATNLGSTGDWVPSFETSDFSDRVAIAHSQASFDIATVLTMAQYTSYFYYTDSTTPYSAISTYLSAILPYLGHNVATSTAPGIVSASTGLSVNADGALTINASQANITNISNTSSALTVGNGTSGNITIQPAADSNINITTTGTGTISIGSGASGGVTISGNLTVSGTLTYTNTTDVTMADDQFIMNYNAVGANPAAYSPPAYNNGTTPALRIRRLKTTNEGDTDAWLGWDETSKRWFVSNTDNTERFIALATDILAAGTAATTTGVNALKYTGNAAQGATGTFDSFTTAPSATQRLNYNGNFYATNFYGNGSNLTSLTAANLSGTIPATVLANSTVYVGTTAIALNRASGAQSLTGVSIDGVSASITNNNYNANANGDALAYAVPWMSGNNLYTTSNKLTFVNSTGTLTATIVANAQWNDIADCIEVPDDLEIKEGRVYIMNDDGTYNPSTKYLDDGIMGVASDTYGFKVGDKEGKNELPIAIGGFVLAYVDQIYKVGTPLTAGPNGMLTEILLPDKRDYPEKVIATFWKIEPNKNWNGVAVNDRMWVKVR